MDNARDVRRGASRFSPAKPHKLFAGSDSTREEFAHSERSKKERQKRLSAVGRTSSSYEGSEMGCDVSDREDELLAQPPPMSIGSSKRFKISKKFFDDSNGVDHASVPRKLRSAMKKRHRESLSPTLPDSKKLTHTVSGVESHVKNGVKGSKLNVKRKGLDWSPEQNLPGPITKDEEEVVETLYALAGMFPSNDANEKSKLESVTMEGKNSALPESRESPIPSFEDSAVSKDNFNPLPKIIAETANASSNLERSPKETAEVDPLTETSAQKRPDLPESKEIRMESDSSIPRFNLYNVPILTKRGSNDEEPPCDAELSGLKQPTRPGTPLNERKAEIALGPAMATASQMEQQNMMKEPKKNGPALWPGLSSVLPCAVGSHGPSIRPSAAKIPGWLDTAIAGSGPSSGKVLKVAVNGNSWKRCATHVYISRLIQILQMPENQESLTLQPNQMKPPQEGSKLGVLTEINNFDGVTSSLNGIVSPNNQFNSTSGRNSNEAKSGILQHQRLHRDQHQAALASGLYPPQKQTFDFLSLSAGGGVVEAKNGTNRAGHGLDSLSQLQVPYLQSLAQHQNFMPFSMPQARYSSSYPDQLSVAPTTSHQVQLQVQPYLGNLICGPHGNQQQQQQQHQQQQQQQHQHHQLQQHQHHQRLWAAQLAAQHRPIGTSTSVTPVSSWQQGRQDSPFLIPCAQAIIPPPPSSLELLGAKYTTVSQQQQHHLMAITSALPPARLKRQDHALPTVCEETGGGFHASGVLPLQLLCNERL